VKGVCSRGHLLVGENVYYVPSTGVRRCRICKRGVWDVTRRKKRRVKRREWLEFAGLIIATLEQSF
jgi:hypothetical protein